MSKTVVHGPTNAALEQALGGVPHYPDHKPEVRSHSFDMGGVVLELRFWALGWRHGRAANFQAVRLDPYTGLFWDVVAELGPGDWFGEGSLLTGAPRRATVVAATACELVEVPKAAFERFS